MYVSTNFKAYSITFKITPHVFNYDYFSLTYENFRLKLTFDGFYWNLTLLAFIDTFLWSGIITYKGITTYYNGNLDPIEFVSSYCCLRPIFMWCDTLKITLFANCRGFIKCDQRVFIICQLEAFIEVFKLMCDGIYVIY